MAVGHKVEKVIETIFEIIFADLNPFRDNALAVLALEVCKDIPILLVLLEILLHPVNIQIRLIVYLLLVPILLQTVNTDLNPTVSKVVSFSMV